MSQLAFWETETVHGPSVVNVAQVPQRSPFRYPGGKTWLVPHVRRWLHSRPHKPTLFVEPFVGGGIVSLTVAFEDLADGVVIVELDEAVAAVWKTMLSDDNDWLAQRILDFSITLDSVREELTRKPKDTKDLAFQTLLKNRTYHGGILANGSSVVKYGENGRGIKSRWYPDTLSKRIQRIKTVRGRILIMQGDGIAAIKKYVGRKRAAFFIDPPYTAAGKRAGTRLYTHHELDHERLFRESKRIRGDFLMTYDNAAEVKEMALRHGFQTTTIPMMNTHHATMQELLIGRDLSWTL